LIRAIFVDLGNFIVYFEPWFFSEALAGYVPGKTAEEIHEILTNDSGSQLLKLFEEDRITDDRYYQEVCMRIGERVPEAAFWDMFSRVQFWPNKPVIDLMRAIRLHHPRLWIIVVSNVDKIRHRYIWNEWLSFANGSTSSCEVRASKPEPIIFRMAMMLAKAMPDECFLADDLMPNVEAARKIGIHAHWYDKEDMDRDRKLHDRLGSLGIRIPFINDPQ